MHTLIRAPTLCVMSQSTVATYSCIHPLSNPPIPPFITFPHKHCPNCPIICPLLPLCVKPKAKAQPWSFWTLNLSPPLSPPLPCHQSHHLHPSLNCIFWISPPLCLQNVVSVEKCDFQTRRPFQSPCPTCQRPDPWRYVCLWGHLRAFSPNIWWLCR